MRNPEMACIYSGKDSRLISIRASAPETVANPSHSYPADKRHLQDKIAKDIINLLQLITWENLTSEKRSCKTLKLNA